MIGRTAHTAADRAPARAFSLVEALVAIAIVGVLIALLVPGLGAVREGARTAACLSNQRQMGMGWSLYADIHDGRAMPLAYTGASLGVDPTGDSIFWWGSAGDATGVVDHDAGFLAPYLDSTLAPKSVYECPAQPWGTYRPQGAARTITSTYGYNGYYLSPEATPGWSRRIGHRPWRRVAGIARPSEVLVFADTLLPGDPPSNTALLDPPMLYRGRGRWRANRAPTTAFRHGASVSMPGSAVGVRADGSAEATPGRPAWIVDRRNAIGSIGTSNDPWYVPDWRRW